MHACMYFSYMCAKFWGPCSFGDSNLGHRDKQGSGPGALPQTDMECEMCTSRRWGVAVVAASMSGGTGVEKLHKSFMTAAACVN